MILFWGLGNRFWLTALLFLHLFHFNSRLTLDFRHLYHLTLALIPGLFLLNLCLFRDLFLFDAFHSLRFHIRLHFLLFRFFYLYRISRCFWVSSLVYFLNYWLFFHRFAWFHGLPDIQLLALCLDLLRFGLALRTDHRVIPLNFYRHLADLLLLDSPAVLVKYLRFRFLDSLRR